MFITFALKNLFILFVILPCLQPNFSNCVVSHNSLFSIHDTGHSYTLSVYPTNPLRCSVFLDEMKVIHISGQILNS